MPIPDEEPDWNRIVEENARRVAQIAVRILGSEHDADDVAQEVFAEAFLVHRREKVLDWTGLLVRLATYRSLDRRRSRRVALSLDQLDFPSQRTGDSQPDEEFIEWLRTEIASLPVRQAAVITLLCFQGMSRDEVAKALDITPENVSATLYQARKRLKESVTLFDEGK